MKKDLFRTAPTKPEDTQGQTLKESTYQWECYGKKEESLEEVKRGLDFTKQISDMQEPALEHNAPQRNLTM